MTRDEFKAQVMKRATSRFKKFDKDQDGVLSEDEAAKAGAAIELENKDKKEDQLRRMAWVSMGSMLVFTGLIFLPFISPERIQVIEGILQTFYIAQAGVMATFFGANAYMTKNTPTTGTEP